MMVSYFPPLLILILLLGFMMKLPLFPLHGWLPELLVLMSYSTLTSCTLLNTQVIPMDATGMGMVTVIVVGGLVMMNRVEYR